MSRDGRVTRHGTEAGWFRTLQNIEIRKVKETRIGVVKVVLVWGVSAADRVELGFVSVPPWHMIQVGDLLPNPVAARVRCDVCVGRQSIRTDGSAGQRQKRSRYSWCLGPKRRMLWGLP